MITGNDQHTPMQLFTHPLVHNPLKVELVLYCIAEESPELAPQILRIERRQIALEQMEQRQPQYLDINPNGRLPSLIHGELTLWESNAIAQYLANIFDSQLWPQDPGQQASVLRWCHWESSCWNPVVGPILLNQFYLPFWGMQGDTERLDKARKKFAGVAKILDNQLQKTLYLTGKAPTLADLCIGAALLHTDRAKLDLTPFPALHYWYQRLAVHAWWQTTRSQVADFQRRVAVKSEANGVNA
ncbi:MULTISPECIES: glutathione S-transferase family protein [Microbulbifer]|uniref:Glutathione S-transferase family protein n=1 Tax=Microbulbifer celer TaxID=435905 RepID=A0ABW3UA85_9GAMM|nr:MULTISPECIES: glutathione S-transferase family protein [Microbulbifer]UFN59023.1 glutathione S-transferase family protein [Microbulbifer celer]